MSYNEYELGVAMGNLTTSINALTDRLIVVEKDMALFRSLVSGGKGALISAILVVAFAVAGVIGAFKQIKDWAT